ncbi:MAG: hypothetical protein WAO58_03915 [Fimbriimonadaceae bacterium]
MPFKLIVQPTAEKAWKALEKPDKVRFDKVGNCLYKLGQDPKSPGLKSKRYKSLDKKHSESIWESYAENNVPAAYRVFWHYGPGKDEITVVAITPHP